MTGTDTHSTLKYKGYEGTIERDDDREIFRGKLLHLADLVTYEADTLSALNQALVEAVDDYIDTCKLLDRVVQRPAH